MSGLYQHEANLEHSMTSRNCKRINHPLSLSIMSSRKAWKTEFCSAECFSGIVLLMEPIRFEILYLELLCGPEEETTLIPKPKLPPYTASGYIIPVIWCLSRLPVKDGTFPKVKWSCCDFVLSETLSLSIIPVRKNDHTILPWTFEVRRNPSNVQLIPRFRLNQKRLPFWLSMDRKYTFCTCQNWVTMKMWESR